MSMETIREAVNNFLDRAEEAHAKGQAVRIMPKAEVVTVGEETRWPKKAFSGRMELLIVIEAPGVVIKPPYDGIASTEPR